MEVKLRTVGNSLAMTIPHAIADMLHLNAGDIVNVSSDDEEVIAKPVKNKSLEAMFAEYKGTYKPEEVDWGSPEGKEVW